MKAWATGEAGVHRMPGRVYNIGRGSRVMLLGVFELLGRGSGRPLVLDRQPPQKGDMRDTYVDSTQARAELGFSPSVAREQGLAGMRQRLVTRPS